jgi:hypothetical protein
MPVVQRLAFGESFVLEDGAKVSYRVDEKPREQLGAKPEYLCHLDGIALEHDTGLTCETLTVKHGHRAHRRVAKPALTSAQGG